MTAANDVRVPYQLVRGGTSKCHVFAMSDVPIGSARDDFLLRALGSPDPRQIDGLGGATSLTSKALLVRPATLGERPAVVTFLFAQVSVVKAAVDYGGTCGNCTAAVAVHAIEARLVPPVEPVTSVRIHNLNTDSMITVDVPVADGHVRTSGDEVIAGVPGSGAAIKLWFETPVGALSGRLMPTGQPQDQVSLTDRDVTVSALDVVNPVAFVQANDVGGVGTELPIELVEQTEVLRRLLEVRAWLATSLNLVKDPAQADVITPGLPKVAMVTYPCDYATIDGDVVRATEVDLVARTLSMGVPHAAFALSSAICTAVAATIPNTTVGMVTGPLKTKPSATGSEVRVRIGHPSGVIVVDLDLDIQGQIQRAGVVRTARLLVDGIAIVRSPGE